MKVLVNIAEGFLILFLVYFVFNNIFWRPMSQSDKGDDFGIFAGSIAVLPLFLLFLCLAYLIFFGLAKRFENNKIGVSRVDIAFLIIIIPIVLFLFKNSWSILFVNVASIFNWMR